MTLYIFVGVPICALVILVTYWRRRDRHDAP